LVVVVVVVVVMLDVSGFRKHSMDSVPQLAREQWRGAEAAAAAGHGAARAEAGVPSSLGRRQVRAELHRHHYKSYLAQLLV
jgi:hypothetical protein